MPEVPGLPGEVRDHYEHEAVEGERLVRGPGRLEFARTQEIIRRHLPPGPLRVLRASSRGGIPQQRA